MKSVFPGHHRKKFPSTRIQQGPSPRPDLGVSCRDGRSLERGTDGKQRKRKAHHFPPRALPRSGSAGSISACCSCAAPPFVSGPAGRVWVRRRSQGAPSVRFLFVSSSSPFSHLTLSCPFAPRFSSHTVLLMQFIFAAAISYFSVSRRGLYPDPVVRVFSQPAPCTPAASHPTPRKRLTQKASLSLFLLNPLRSRRRRPRFCFQTVCERPAAQRDRRGE